MRRQTGRRESKSYGHWGKEHSREGKASAKTLRQEIDNVMQQRGGLDHSEEAGKEVQAGYRPCFRSLLDY